MKGLRILQIPGELIVSRYVAESITTDTGCFGHVGLCQLCTKLSLTVAIDSATYLLTISSPDIDNIAMSLYDITSDMSCVHSAFPADVFTPTYIPVL